MRLDRYQEFILESDGKMMIFYSDAFRSLLTYMATGSKSGEPEGVIARRLLNSENREEFLDGYTLIDKTGKNDMISYVQASRFYREHPDLKDELPKMRRHNQTISGSKFWTSGRTPEYGIGRWARRVYKDVLDEPVKDSEIEAFVNYYKSTYDGVYKGAEAFELVKGEDIRKWYLVDRYEEENGQLGNSCMRYKRCQPYLDIYVQNPDTQVRQGSREDSRARSRMDAARRPRRRRKEVHGQDIHHKGQRQAKVLGIRQGKRVPDKRVSYIQDTADA
jgi:hypothetical protein